MAALDISPLTRIVAQLDRLRDGQPDPARLTTAFPSLDRILTGGLRRGDLIVLGGDHGTGCSSFALGVALRLRERSLFLTSEMTRERAYQRALAIRARVPLDELRLGAIDRDERDRLAAAAQALGDAPLVIDVLPDTGIEGLPSWLASGTPPDLLIVDGLEALLPIQGTRSRDEALAHAVLALKRLAVQSNIAVLLLTHLPALDRSRSDLRPRLTDFGVLGAVGIHADVVLGLFREEVYDREFGVSGAAELLLLKHRDGPSGYVDLFFDARWLRFDEVMDIPDLPELPSR